MPTSCLTVKRTRSDKNSTLSAPAHCVPTVLLPRGPEVEPRLTVVNPEARRLQCRPHQVAAKSIQLLLGGDVLIIAKHGSKSRLDRCRDNEPQVFASQKELLNKQLVTGNKCRAIASKVRLLTRRIQSNRSRAITLCHLLVKRGWHRNAVPSELSVTLVARNHCAKPPRNT